MLSSEAGREERDLESWLAQNGNCCADSISADGPPSDQYVHSSHEGIMNIYRLPGTLLSYVRWIGQQPDTHPATLSLPLNRTGRENRKSSWGKCHTWKGHRILSRCTHLYLSSPLNITTSRYFTRSCEASPFASLFGM